VTLPLLVLGTLCDGLMGAAYATLIATALGIIFDLYLGLSLLSLSIFTLLAAIWRSLIGGAIMVAAVLALEMYWQVDSIAGSMLMLIIFVTLGAVTYSFGVFLLWVIAGFPRGAEYHLVALLKGGLESFAQKTRYMSQAARVTPAQSKFPRQSL